MKPSDLAQVSYALNSNEDGLQFISIPRPSSSPKAGVVLHQAWIPLYLGSLGVRDMGSVGLLCALPWLVRRCLASLRPYRYRHIMLIGL